MLKRYMHNRERHLALLNDNRSPQQFGWGLEFVADHVNGDDPRKVLADLFRSMHWQTATSILRLRLSRILSLSGGFIRRSGH
ncbi:MAG: hypothetical protein IPK98_01930 [Chloracidobacterium sp.]|nr:hypothetical protein [Chloracidobacterium sp.]